MKLDISKICAYCADVFGQEKDHVLGRQFLPNETKYRDGLPKVPACAKCNRLKQKYEDSAAVILQFGHDSEASRKVLDQRVTRTLRKNDRLARAMHDGARVVWVPHESGLVVRTLAIDINPQELFHLNQWFRLLVKGLYRFELGVVLPKPYTTYLLKPESREEYECLGGFLLASGDPQKRSLAAGEFKYTFVTAAHDEAFTMWALAFKSVEVFAVTLGQAAPSSLTKIMQAREWLSAPPRADHPNRQILLP